MIKGVVIIEGLLLVDIELGHKCLYQQIFKKNFGKITTIEYDLNRNANICLTHYEDGEKQYILHPQGIKIGGIVISNIEAPILVGNALPLSGLNYSFM
jgi:large subunit ribosomal protein L2